MPYTIRSFEETPNPRALKCTIDPAPAPPVGVGGRRSYAGADEAERAGDGFAMALLSVDGVERVMVLSDFVTVTREESAKWSRVKPRLERVLKDLA